MIHAHPGAVALGVHHKWGVDSEPGKGSTFWFTARLGVADARQLPDADVAVLPSGYQRDAYVLMAEDNEVNAEIALDILHTAGLKVDTAVDGSQALEMAGKRHYDLVLMDMQMLISLILTPIKER